MNLNVDEILNNKRDSQDTSFLKLGLKFNPFPKSGTANVNESNDLTKFLVPIETEIHKKIVEYVADSLYSRDENDHKLICTITGDYGTGKTQLLLYAKWLIQNQSQTRKAYVVYVNNPGTKLSELIGQVIESIGQEQFKKYLWGQIIETIKLNVENCKDELLKFAAQPDTTLFRMNDPFCEENEANHKAFLDAFLKIIPTKEKKKEFNEKLKQIIITVLKKQNSEDDIIAEYFYNIISEDFGFNKTWETIISGSGQHLDSKAVKLLNAIINIVSQQGFERFYLIVDEFEDITSGRLTKKEVDNYSHNLRTLIDRERRWCLLLAMTSDALNDLRKISPPLVDRLTDREIKITRLTNDQTEKLALNYLSYARVETKMINDIYPFSKEALEYINSISKGLPRLVLRRIYYLLERAVELLPEGDIISKEFVESHLL